MHYLKLAFWNDLEARIRCLWRFLIHAMLMAGAMLTLMFVMEPVSNLFAGPNARALAMGSGAVMQNTLMVVIVFAACVWPDRRSIRSLGAKLDSRWWIDCFGGFGLGAAMMTLIFLIEYSLGWITVRANTETDIGWTVGSANWLIAMIFVGTGEEIVSRGYHLKNLCEGFRKLGVTGSIVLSSALSSGFFALLHSSNPNATAVSLSAIFLAGIMFCVGRIVTGSLAAPIGLHVAWNYVQGGVLGFPVSGNRMDGSLLRITQGGDPFWTGGAFGPEAGMFGVLAVLIMTMAFFYWPKPERRRLAYAAEMAKPPRRKKLRPVKVA